MTPEALMVGFTMWLYVFAIFIFLAVAALFCIAEVYQTAEPDRRRVIIKATAVFLFASVIFGMVTIGVSSVLPPGVTWSDGLAFEAKR